MFFLHKFDLKCDKHPSKPATERQAAYLVVQVWAAATARSLLSKEITVLLNIALFNDLDLKDQDRSNQIHVGELRCVALIKPEENQEVKRLFLIIFYKWKKKWWEKYSRVWGSRKNVMINH